MKPGGVAVAQAGDIGDRVKVTRVDLACVGDHDCRPSRLVQLALERTEVKAPDAVFSEPTDVGSTQAKHPDRLDGARVQIPA